MVNPSVQTRFLTNLVTADEAAFVLNGKVNTWNNKE